MGGGVKTVCLLPQQTSMNMEQLHAENTQLTQQVALLAAQVPQLQAHTAPPPQRKCPVAVPDKYDGNQAVFPAFLGQCHLRAEDFPMDQDKVGFMISLLSSSAVCWVMPLLVQDSPLLDNFSGFCDHLWLMYEDPIKTQTVAQCLKDLKQGWQPLQEYISEFRLLSQDSAWKEAALMDSF
uniref:DUF4939 domain-containing protein n=1 Tax=Pseudonaja textilis TaxID=8673 RepID=A0A670XPS2_PSETE